MLTLTLEPADQVGDQHDAAGEHTHHHQRPPADVALHLIREPADTGGQFICTEKDFHRVAALPEAVGAVHSLREESTAETSRIAA